LWISDFFNNEFIVLSRRLLKILSYPLNGVVSVKYLYCTITILAPSHRHIVCDVPDPEAVCEGEVVRAGGGRLFPVTKILTSCTGSF